MVKDIDDLFQDNVEIPIKAARKTGHRNKNKNINITLQDMFSLECLSNTNNE